LGVYLYALDHRIPDREFVNGALANANGYKCLQWAADLLRLLNDSAREREVRSQVCARFNSVPDCARYKALGGDVDVNAVVGAANLRKQQAEAREQQYREDRAERHSESEARFNAVMGTLQSMPGGSDPNAIVNAGNQQAAATRAVGDANAAQQQAAAQQRLATEKAAQQSAASGSSSAQGAAPQGAALPTTHPQAPLTVRFQTVTGYQGNARVVSNPPGIDCPGACSFQFPQNISVMLSATADQSSAVKSLSCQMSAGTGVLKAGNAMSCSIPQWAYAGPQVIVYVDSYPAPGTASSASNGTGANGSGSGGSSGGNGNSSGSGGGNSSASSAQYAAPLSNNCVRSFWDPQYYNWLSYENVCSQTIHIDYMFKDPKYGGASSTTLVPGQHSNTGWSSNEINDHGPLLYFVCPANYLAVDSNTDKFVNQNTSGYRCKKQ